MAYLQQSCLTNPLKFPTHKSKARTPNPFFIVSCKCPPNAQNQDNSPRKLEKQLAKVAMVTFAAGVLTLGSVSDASAAKSGGQIGGQAFGSSAPRSTFSKVNSRTSIFVNPPIAPSLVGGYGYGFGFGVPFYGGWGSSPFSFFTPGPSITSIVKGGFDLLVLFMCLGFIFAVVDEFFEFDDDDDDDEDEEEEEIINRRRDRG